MQYGGKHISSVNSQLQNHLHHVKPECINLFVILATHTNDKRKTNYDYWSNTCHQYQYEIETADHKIYCRTGPRQETTKECIIGIDLFLQSQHTPSLVHQLSMVLGLVSWLVYQH